MVREHRPSWGRAVQMAFVLFGAALFPSGHARGESAIPARGEAVRGLGAPLSPFWLRTERGKPLLTYSSELHERAPLVLFLHGMCDTPQNECAWFHAAVTPAGYLVCPRASGRCPNGTAKWEGSLVERAAEVRDSVEAVKGHFGDRVDVEGDGVLVGFSQGAYEAVRIVGRETGPWTYLVLIGAKVELSARMLRDHGIRAVLLAAGDYDQAAPWMKRVAQSIDREGVRARFESLGAVGHRFAPDMEAWMAQAIGWLREEES